MALVQVFQCVFFNCKTYSYWLDDRFHNNFYRYERHCISAAMKWINWRFRQKNRLFTEERGKWNISCRSCQSPSFEGVWISRYRHVQSAVRQMRSYLDVHITNLRRIILVTFIFYFQIRLSYDQFVEHLLSSSIRLVSADVLGAEGYRLSLIRNIPRNFSLHL